MLAVAGFSLIPDIAAVTTLVTAHGNRDNSARIARFDWRQEILSLSHLRRGGKTSGANVGRLGSLFEEEDFRGDRMKQRSS
jgi:hypothetical protein